MRASLAALLGWVVVGCGGCILPVPHTRVQAYGVTGQVVSATTQAPLAEASVIAMDQPDPRRIATRPGGSGFIRSAAGMPPIVLAPYASRCFRGGM
jgi:hypothetical protein